MLKDLFLLLLTGHILGDFYLQSYDGFDKKTCKSPLQEALTRSIAYGGGMILVFLFIFEPSFIHLLSFLGLVFISFLIKLVKLKIYKKYETITPAKELNIFTCDQLAHSIALLLFSYWLFTSPIKVVEPALTILARLNISAHDLIRWIFAILALWRPFSLATKKVLDIFEPSSEGSTNEEKKENGQQNAGALIGKLERLIILLLIAHGQYGAIGLVISAKSIARFNKLSKEPDFAERYLIGTLLSTLLVMVTGLIVF